MLLKWEKTKEENFFDGNRDDDNAEVDFRGWVYEQVMWSMEKIGNLVPRLTKITASGELTGILFNL